MSPEFERISSGASGSLESGTDEEPAFHQGLQGLFVDLADPQVGGHGGGLPLDIDDLEVFQLRLQGVEVRRVQFLVGRQRPGDHVLLRRVKSQVLDELPGLVARGHIQDEFALGRRSPASIWPLSGRPWARHCNP